MKDDKDLENYDDYRNEKFLDKIDLKMNDNDDDDEGFFDENNLEKNDNDND